LMSGTLIDSTEKATVNELKGSGEWSGEWSGAARGGGDGKK
jgi:hypothetical protein